MRRILKISLLVILALSVSGCETLKTLSSLGGQSGGTQQNISVPIGDNKKQVKVGDEIKVDKTEALIINNLNRFAPFTNLITIALFLIFILIVLFYIKARNTLPLVERRRMNVLESDKSSKDAVIHTQAKMIELLISKQNGEKP